MADEINTHGLEASGLSTARGMPLVKGECPACGKAALFLGVGGYVTCGSLSCPRPDAASDVLAVAPEAAS